MKLTILNGWQLLAPGAYRWPMLMLTLIALCSHALASRDIPIDLPTTVICYDERGGRRVIGGTNILVSDGGDTYRAPTVELPFLFAGKFRYVKAAKLSIDGNYVFVSGGRDGLYRCDLSSRTWKTIRPAGARASAPAIAVGPDGTLYAGIGSQRYNASFTGLYRSTDNGDSWTEMVLTRDSVRMAASILDIQVSREGRLFIRGQIGTSFDEVLPDGTLKRIEGTWLLLHNERVTNYGTGSIRFGKKPGDTSKTNSYRVSGDTLIKGAVAWPDSDTVLAMVSQGGRYAANLILNGTIVRSFDLGAMIDNYTPWIAPSYDGGRRCILFFGLGQNSRIYLDNGQIAPLDIPTEYPLVTKLLCTRDWGLAEVARYGWFRFDSSGKSRYDSAVSQHFFYSQSVNVSKLSGRLIIADYTLRAKEVTASGIDTVVTSPPGYWVNSADLNEDSNDLYWAIDPRVFRTNLTTNATDSFALTGWPFTEAGMVPQPFAVSGVTVFGRRILAWASSTSTTPEDQAKEGLYEFADSVWRFVRGSTDGRRTRLIASGRNDSIVVFSIAEDLGMLGYSAPSIVMMRYADTVAVLCPTAEIFITGVTSLTTLGESALFTTSTDQLYRAGHQMPPVEIDLGTKVFEAVEMDRYVAISSGSRGVFLIPKSELVTTVQDNPPASFDDGPAEVYPNPVEPGQPLTINLPRCCQQPKIVLVDLLGRVASPEGSQRASFQDGNRCTVNTQVPAGHYLVRVAGQACLHVIPVLVRR